MHVDGASSLAHLVGVVVGAWTPAFAHLAIYTGRATERTEGTNAQNADTNAQDDCVAVLKDLVCIKSDYFVFALQPHQKYNIKQYEENGFS